MSALLAQDVPSLSWPAGSVPIEEFNQPQTDLMSLNTKGWPGERLSGNPPADDLGRTNRWFHSDLKEVSYFYVFGLFDLIVKNANHKVMMKRIFISLMTLLYCYCTYGQQPVFPTARIKLRLLNELGKPMENMPIGVGMGRNSLMALTDPNGFAEFTSESSDQTVGAGAKASGYYPCALGRVLKLVSEG